MTLEIWRVIRLRMGSIGSFRFENWEYLYNRDEILTRIQLCWNQLKADSITDDKDKSSHNKHNHKNNYKTEHITTASPAKLRSEGEVEQVAHTPHGGPSTQCQNTPNELSLITMLTDVMEKQNDKIYQLQQAMMRKVPSNGFTPNSLSPEQPIHTSTP